MLVTESSKKLFSSRLFSGGIWMLVGRVTTLILGLTVSGLLTRILAPDDMGVFVFVESLVLTAVIFAQLGLGHTAVKLITYSLVNQNLATTRKIISYILQWGILGSVLAAIFMFLVGVQIGISESLIVLVSGWIIIFAPQLLLADIFRGFHDFRSFVLIGGSRVGGVITLCIITSLLFIIWVVFGSIDLGIVLGVFLFSGLPTILFAIVWLPKKLRQQEDPIGMIGDQEVNISKKEILWTSLPILVATVTTVFLSKSGIWVTAAFRSPAEVAIFGVVVKLAAIISVQMNFFETLISPTVADLYTKKLVQKLEILLRSITTLLSIVSIFIFLAFVLFGSNILSFIYGEFYSIGAVVLILLVIGPVTGVITGPCGIVLVMTGNQNTLMVIDIISSLLSITLMLVLVHQMGITGVAIAIALGTIVKNIMMLLAVKKLTGIWTHATVRFDRRVISNLLNIA